MKYTLALQSTYHNVSLGLFHNSHLQEKIIIDKKKASKLLAPSIHQLLEIHHCDINTLEAIIANQGPGPFTTLRVVIATVNGLSFASNIPLIGIDAFDAMLAQYQDHTYPTTIILFNAFANDVYFAIQQKGNTLQKGYMHINQLIETCHNIDGLIRFIGNGATLYQKQIEQALGDQAYLPKPMPDYCSLEIIAHLGIQEWNTKSTGVEQLFPLYLKKHPAEQQLISSCSTSPQ